MTTPPPVDPGPLDGWRRTETTAETVFDLGSIEVTTATAVYEDPDLRARMRDVTGVDRTWRFFFATRVDVPGWSDAGVLRRLVAARATTGFVSRLRDRGFSDVREADRRRLKVGDHEARAVRYDATLDVDGVAVDADGWIAVWADAEGFLLAGGVYPRAVRSASMAGSESRMAELVDPDAFRADLFALIRATG